MPEWHLYLIRTRLGTLYTGITTNVARRLAEHAGQGRRGSKYLRSKGPLTLAYQIEIGSQSLALRAEQRIKRLAKAQKEDIIATQPDSESLLAMVNLQAQWAASIPARRSQSRIDLRSQKEP